MCVITNEWIPELPQNYSLKRQIWFENVYANAETSFLQSISAKAMDCRQTSSHRVTTTSWCCLCCRACPTKWTLPSMFALCFLTRASMPCSWTRIPNWSRCCWPTPASLTTVRCRPRSVCTLQFDQQQDRIVPHLPFAHTRACSNRCIMPCDTQNCLFSAFNGSRISASRFKGTTIIQRWKLFLRCFHFAVGLNVPCSAHSRHKFSRGEWKIKAVEPNDTGVKPRL